MKTARTLTIAALAALATLGAQAAEPNGDMYGKDFESKAASVRERADVRAEGKQAAPNFNKGPVADPAKSASSTQQRPAVRSEGAKAALAGRVGVGEKN